MTEEYIRSLRKQLTNFSPNEQEALIEEISSHIESGVEDSKIGKDKEERRIRIMNELGSPKDMSKGFKAIYRPDRLIDYLLIAVPCFFYPYLNSLYISLMPKYSWADVRLDVIIHLPLIAIGLWRRSAPVTLFWTAMIVSQLLFITTQIQWYYGIQTIFWALLLLALLGLAGNIIWKNRHDLLIVVFGLMPLGMCVIGNILSVIRPTDYTPYNFLDRSLLNIHLYITHFDFDSTLVIILAVIALFFLPANRTIRWLALVLYGLTIGIEHVYLTEDQTGNMALMAHWVYYLWIILPLLMVFFGWWIERSSRRQLELAAV